MGMGKEKARKVRSSGNKMQQTGKAETRKGYKWDKQGKNRQQQEAVNERREQVRGSCSS